MATAQAKQGSRSLCNPRSLLCACFVLSHLIARKKTKSGWRQTSFKHSAHEGGDEGVYLKLSCSFFSFFFFVRYQEKSIQHDHVTSNQMREAKALILRLEQEKKTAIQDMMDNLQTALREKDEAVNNASEMRKVLQEREAQNEEMKKEKDEFFLKMEKQLEESEKRREIAELKKEREIQEMTAKYEAAAAAEENERKSMMEKLKRDKAEVVAVMQKDKNEKLEEMLVAKEMELQEALTKKTKEVESILHAKEEEMKLKYNEKVLQKYTYAGQNPVYKLFGE